MCTARIHEYWIFVNSSPTLEALKFSNPSKTQSLKSYASFQFSTVHVNQHWNSNENWKIVFFSENLKVKIRFFANFCKIKWQKNFVTNWIDWQPLSLVLNQKFFPVGCTQKLKIVIWSHPAQDICVTSSSGVNLRTWQ